ncbi:hypothetical protein [Enhygromyxa salina]|uniref:Orc1-like AAA ATPase domain-containing protein n=1 Tax=Enhygromyxa salina TaxID=215803 RepID=A0A2S9YYL1_9BACT|nr:hypothetical protein [Enhygromyxa salina]PRQ10188.1 hypothetical protein ENSA7_01370 [Enhygromyxa salina]
MAASAPHVSDDELREWMNACDPKAPIPPSDPRFVDFYRFAFEGEELSLRGEDPDAGLATLADAIELAGDTSCQLFSGFSGTGKSSELLGLKQELEAKGYLVLLADASEYLNLRHPLTITDLLVVVAAAFGDVANERIGADLGKAGYLRRVLDVVRQDVELDGLKLPTGIGDLRLAINTNQPFWTKARERLAVSIGRLRADAHGYVEEIVTKLRVQEPAARGVVFIFDSLEKIRSARPEEFGAVIQSIVEVFVNQAELLRFPCHVVYTMPPYVRQLELGTLYTQVSEVLPAIRVHERQRITLATGSERSVPARYAPGIEALCEVVRRRIPVERVFGDDDALLRELVAYSGGHVRLLLTFVRDALLKIKRTGLPIAALSIKQVLQRHREDAERNLWRERLPILRDVLAHGELPGMPLAQLPVLASVLDDYTVLCYRNGDGWYDVHPLVREKLLELLEREAADGA